MKSILLCLGLILASTIAVMGQTSSALVDVSGVIFSTSQQVVPGAKVTLRCNAGSKQRTTTSDAVGSFRFARVAHGSCEIEVQQKDCKPAIVQLSIGSRPPAPLQIVLEIADLHDEVTVNNQSGQVNINPSENLDVIKLDRDALSNLPILGNDVIGTLKRLVDASSRGSGGPTVIVDGLETTKKVPASMIQEVRINQNPYSAEFSRPGRGRIEVITKAGSTEYHGELDFLFRDHRLDARNALAPQRPPEQRRILEGTLTGPIGSGKKTSFLFGANREEENLQAVINAITPAGRVSQNVATPQRATEFSFRFNHQFSEKTTFSIRYEFSR